MSFSLPIPSQTLDELLARYSRPVTRQRYPVTFDERAEGGGAEIFEPALKHYGNAFRRGDPELADTADRARWYAARNAMMDHVLRLVATSKAADALVLRGSLLLKAWLGDQARTPGDIDWVVTPSTRPSNSPEAILMIEELAALMAAKPDAGLARIETQRIAMDRIWTYDRADGLRVALPWRAEGLPGGSVQMDFVFCETLTVPAEPLALPLSDGSSVTFNAATRELSLAWKLLWLQTDFHPQGKDLYDAVLLAESTSLSHSVLEQVFGQAREGQLFQRMGPDFPDQLDLEWSHFAQEYPWVPGDARLWQRRLTEALAPTFRR